MSGTHLRSGGAMHMDAPPTTGRSGEGGRRLRFDRSPWWSWARRAWATLLLIVMAIGWATNQAAGFVLYGSAAIVVVTVGQRVLARAQSRLVRSFLGDPLAPENRPYLVQLGLRSALAAAVVATGPMIIPRVQVTDTEYYLALCFLLVGPAVVFVFLQLVPARPISFSLNVVAAVALAFVSFQLFTIHFRSGLTDAVSIAAPFEGEWDVLAGGRSTLLSHHYSPLTPMQKHAIDLVVTRDGRTFEGDEADPGSYHAWDEAILAPADGVVVAVENDLPDWPVGQSETDRNRAAGNNVVIDVGAERFVQLSHLRQGTVTVAVGDRVAVGDIVGRVGNSGSTNEPHLHVQVQDTATYEVIWFDATHVRGGTEHLAQQSQLRRNDIIRPDG